MYWELETEAEAPQLEGVSFNPSLVLQLSQISADLPWLSTLDPYKNRVISGDELTTARRELSIVGQRYRSQFLEDRARRRKTHISQLDHDPFLREAWLNQLTQDPFYHTINDVLTLLEIAFETSTRIKVIGT